MEFPFIHVPGLPTVPRPLSHTENSQPGFEAGTCDARPLAPVSLPPSLPPSLPHLPPSLPLSMSCPSRIGLGLAQAVQVPSLYRW